MFNNQDKGHNPKEVTAYYADRSFVSIAVSYGDKIRFSTTTPKTLAYVLSQISSSDVLATAVKHIRAISDPEKRRDAKQQLLPFFTFSQFKDNKRNNASFLRTSFLIADLDHLGDNLQEIRTKVHADGHVFVCFQSPSGDGLKVVYRLAEDITDEKVYRATFEFLLQKIRDTYDIEPDTDADPARACFLSSDPDVYVNPSCAWVPVVTSMPPPVRKPQVSKSIQTLDESGIISALQGSSAGGRHHNAITVAGYLLRYGVPEKVTVPLVQGMNLAYNSPPKDAPAIEEAVRDTYKRYATQSQLSAAEFRNLDNAYYKVTRKGKNEYLDQVTTFSIDPKELLVLPDKDCLSCTVTSAQGHAYERILIENADWQSKNKLLSAIGHQDCTFLGSDRDIQLLCDFVNRSVPVRKTGTRVIGLHENIWVVEGLNISCSGISLEPTIVPYDKGSGAFHHKIGYVELNDDEYHSLVNGLYADILDINDRKVLLPLLGWFFATPVKEIVRASTGAFPSLLVQGAQGSGKTSTTKMLMRLAGYKNPVPNKCDMRPFPMMKNLSATNGVPQFYDEFKQSDMRDDQVDSLLRYIREIYDGELETKGREDQSTVDYELLAPMAVLGEWNISQPAIRERTLMVRYSDAVKKHKELRAPFKRLLELPLEGFMPRYIQFCLNQDIVGMLGAARRHVDHHFESKNVAPRIVNNLAVMLLGLMLFQDYAAECGLRIPAIDPEVCLDDQLNEITGTDGGQVRSAVDQLITELGIMWQKNEKQITSTPGYDAPVRQTPWWKTADVENRKAIAVRFNKVFPEFKEYAQRTKYEGDLLDKDSYMRLFKDCAYVAKTDHPVDFEGKKYRCLCVDIEKAKATGLDMEGFGIAWTDPNANVTDVTSMLQSKCNKNMVNTDQNRQI